MIAVSNDRNKLQAAIREIGRAVRIKLEECLICTFCGRLVVSCHIQDGVLNHVKVNSRRTSIGTFGERATKQTVDDVLSRLILVFEHEVSPRLSQDYHGSVIMSWDVDQGKLTEVPEVSEEQVHKITKLGR